MARKSRHLLSAILKNLPLSACRWIGIRRVLYATLLCGLPIALNCSSENGLRFDETEVSFRNFSRCVVDADLAGRKLEFQDAWLQNVVPAQIHFGLEETDDSSESEEPANEAYVVTGVIRATQSSDSPKDSLAVLLVRKVLDKYKVVNWATDLERDYERSIPVLSSELLGNPYKGKCTW